MSVSFVPSSKSVSIHEENGSPGRDVPWYVLQPSKEWETTTSL